MNHKLAEFPRVWISNFRYWGLNMGRRKRLEQGKELLLVVFGLIDSLPLNSPWILHGACLIS